MTGADLLALALRERGVEFVTTLCGNGLNPFYLACRDANIRLVDCRNEQAAAYMADAYARLTRRVGVCAVSSGIAHVEKPLKWASTYCARSSSLGSDAIREPARGISAEQAC